MAHGERAEKFGHEWKRYNIQESGRFPQLGISSDWGKNRDVIIRRARRLKRDIQDAVIEFVETRRERKAQKSQPIRAELSAVHCTDFGVWNNNRRIA